VNYRRDTPNTPFVAVAIDDFDNDRPRHDLLSSSRFAVWGLIHRHLLRVDRLSQVRVPDRWLRDHLDPIPEQVFEVFEAGDEIDYGAF